MSNPQPVDSIPEERAIDPNVSQRRASDPDHSVWVGASAGTGKTKVLTDRVLRLLLPRPDGREGTQPHRILCLTFTKAAASEMLQRINATLSSWATMDEKDSRDKNGDLVKGLRTRLRELTGKEPDNEDLQAARRLFASVVDTPGGLKVMTIHSFCQSVLGRFPIEAGLPPHFSVIDDNGANELLSRARDQALEKAKQDPDAPLGLAVRHIAAWQNEDQFGKLLRSLCSEQRQLNQLQASPQELHKRVCAFYGISANDTTQSIIAAACADDAFDKDALYDACKVLAGGSKTDVQRGIDIQLWLDGGPDERAAGIDKYQKTVLTNAGTPRANLATKAVAEAMPEVIDILSAEAQRLMVLADQLKAVQSAALTHDLFILGKDIVENYQELKEQRALLDYNDLILSTLALFEKENIAPWVMFKLDGGLDHILVDEAQDTNPEQWDVIKKLTEEFLSGETARNEVKRTCFTVGDEKQSIYSFQRASPKIFEQTRQDYIETGQVREENLITSFRSVKTVLRLVDEVFRPEDMRQGLGRDAVEHISFRRGQAGLAELWPLFTPDEEQSDEPWTPPLQTSDVRSGQAKLAEHIGETIKGWLDNKEEIPSLGRAMEAGDIMILMRTRTAFVGQLVRALKTRSIPVSGVDRMVLGEQIAVMDLLALAKFALLPGDDLSLACALKSPLISFDDDALYDLAIDRGGTLWDALRSKAQSDAKIKDIRDYLDDLITDGASDHPYEFFSRILQRPCPHEEVSGLRAIRQRLGDDALDPLDEFLNAALSYEHDHIPTLQGFLVWQQQGDITIKRELEEAGQAVRIMTVHGSKGLQAPVVILPDTTRTAVSKKIDTLLWPEKTGLDTPLWAARSDDFPARYKEARSRLEQALDEEYRRLLYVALTRAEDRLYIGGYQGKRKPIDDCWYNHIRAAFERFEGVETILGEDSEVLRIHDPQSAEPDRIKDRKHKENREKVTPEPWLFEQAGEEEYPPRPLMPSRQGQDADEPAVRSPLSEPDEHRFKRGNITHMLLQILPDLPHDKRAAAALNYVQQPAHDLQQDMQENIVKETMDVLDHPSYAALFGEGSLAEVPITGFVNGQLVSARLDRLLVTDGEAWIVDYKTNRPPPTETQKVPQIYIDQMKAYSDIVATIYPDKKIRSFLLWTDGPHLMELPDA